MADYKDLRVVHASLQFSDNSKQAQRDLERLAELKPHILLGTESGDRDRKELIKSVLRDYDYNVYTPGNTDGWVAARKSLTGSGWGASYREVIPRGSKAGDPHHYSAKGVVQMWWDHPSLGHMGALTSHYLLTPKPLPRDPVDHEAENKKLAHALGDAAILHSAGTGISFVSADTNMVDRTNDVFYGRPLTTCWDETKNHPNTGHGNIDVVATVNSDGRVKCKSAEALDDKDLFMHTDHFVVVTKYRVLKLNRQKD
jgi:hypothetical protein